MGKMNDEIKFQYYPAQVKSNQPQGFVKLSQFINVHRKPNNKIRSVFDKIAIAEATGNMKLKAELKQNNLHYFTPCVIINKYRRYANIERFTGLMILDFDHLESVKYSIQFKEFLFHEYKSIIAIWLSPSKHGVKALISIPIVDSPDEFKKYFFGMAVELDQFNGFDGTPQNAVLPLFQSYDPDLLNRKDYAQWTEKGYKVNSFNNENITPPPDIDISDRDRYTVTKIIHSGFNNIIDNGHPQLRSLCIVIGGYIATRYIDELEAVQLIDYSIENHSYLNKDVIGYKKTARWGIEKGKSKPVILR